MKKTDRLSVLCGMMLTPAAAMAAQTEKPTGKTRPTTNPSLPFSTSKRPMNQDFG